MVINIIHNTTNQLLVVSNYVTIWALKLLLYEMWRCVSWLMGCKTREVQNHRWH